MSVIAVFGGTFNPFHIGHYEMLKYVCELEFIDRVFLTPDNIPPHKTCDFLADDTDRIAMCRLIADEFDKCEVCLIEFEREGKSYTVDTVKELKKRYPNDIFYWVIGGDMLVTLDKWYNFEELFSLVSFIAFNRADIDNFYSYLDKMRGLGAKIHLMEQSITDVSSTQLRSDTVKELLPPRIYNYITEKGIYNDQN